MPTFDPPPDRTRRTRVLHLITWMDLGGAQDHLLRLVEGLDTDRFDLTVAVGTSSGSRGELFAPLEASGRVVPLRHLCRQVSPAHDVLAIGEVGRLIDRLQPDIVHTHSSKAGVVGRVAAASRSVRTVHNVHGWSFRATTNPALRQAATVLERRLAAHTDVMLNVSEADRLLGEDLGIRARVATKVVRGGIDLEKFRHASHPRNTSRDPERPVLGTVGRLAPAKDPFTAVEAVRILVDDRPGLRFRWVGDGPMRAEVEQRVGELDLASNVELVGARTDVPAQLADMDVFVLSSRFEGLPRSLMEATAAGVPVVATGVGGVGELISDHRTGLLVEPGDPVALASALAEALQDREATERRAVAAAEAASEYSIEAMCERTAAVYEFLVA